MGSTELALNVGLMEGKEKGPTCRCGQALHVSCTTAGGPSQSCILTQTAGKRLVIDPTFATDLWVLADDHGLQHLRVLMLAQIPGDLLQLLVPKRKVPIDRVEVVQAVSDFVDAGLLGVVALELACRSGRPQAHDG